MLWRCNMNAVIGFVYCSLLSRTRFHEQKKERVDGMTNQQQRIVTNFFARATSCGKICRLNDRESEGVEMSLNWMRLVFTI